MIENQYLNRKLKKGVIPYHERLWTMQAVVYVPYSVFFFFQYNQCTPPFF